MICAGIDAGSRAIKAVLIDAETLEIQARGITGQGVKQDALARQLFNSLLIECGLSHDDVKRTVATGYGRNIVSIADTTVTEITCHAVGVHQVVPDAMTVVDIGDRTASWFGSTKQATFAIST